MSSSAAAAFSTAALPVVVRDPRFVAGRATVGQQTSIDVFGTLLQEAVGTYGESDIEAAPAYYEYGNALFRVAQRQLSEEVAAAELDEQTAHTSKQAQAKSTREAAAAAAERRAKGGDTDQKPAAAATTTDGDENIENIEKDGEIEINGDEASEEEGDDVQLALEMMETAWSILDNEQQQTPNEAGASPSKYSEWISEQVPRVLTGIGDVLSVLNRHADAADAYLRALGHRQQALDEEAAVADKKGTLLLLQCRRKAVEANILIVEELLACGNDNDVVTTESKVVLVKAGSVVDYARGYYDKARDELQEAVVLLGQLAASHVDTADEKENICFVATMVMGAGTALAEIDELAAVKQDEPAKKKAKA